jgi:hypothetical protein
VSLIRLLLAHYFWGFLFDLGLCVAFAAMSAPYTSSENRTKHSDRAAAGQTRLTKSGQGPPDTVIKLPDGRTIAL